MVVRFDLEDGRESLTDVDRAGILARALQHLRPLGRQGSQVNPRALVAAVLRPHDRKNAELRQVRIATETRDDALILVGREAVLLDDPGIDHGSFRPRGRRPTPSSRLPSALTASRAGRMAQASRRFERVQNGLENHPAVFPAEQAFDCPLGMRHHAHDISLPVADARDSHGPIRSDSRHRPPRPAGSQ